MAFPFKWYTDAALTQELTGSLTTLQNVDGSTGPVLTQLWLGAIDSLDFKLQTAVNPGVDNIVISILDSNPGVGYETTIVGLGLTSGGAAAATKGAPLDLGVVEIQPDTAGAIEFWVWVDAVPTPPGIPGTSTELSLQTNLVRQTPL